jgi:hypothetical protein
LSLLLKTSPLITELALYDVVNTPGVAADLSHISSPAVCIQNWKGKEPADEGYRKSLATCQRMTVLSRLSRMQTLLSSQLEFLVRIKHFWTIYMGKRLMRWKCRQARNDP